MQIVKEIQQHERQLIQWRREIHAHPELAFKEFNTRTKVCELLTSFGIELDIDNPKGLAGTGVVGKISAGTSNRTIGLRADMDALPITESNCFSYRSRCPGIMHGCGHDGHVAMLLGAAQYLAKCRNFDGTVYLIFQPAEENEGGARVMVEDGLFERYPVDQVFALHNWPGLAAGKFAIKPGAMMASLDTFEITLKGDGCHAATPHQGQDVILAASDLVGSLHSIVNRRVDIQNPAVLSVTRVHGGQSDNVLPDSIVLGGTTRCYCERTRQQIQDTVESITAAVAQTHLVQSEVNYQQRYPATINHPGSTALAQKLAVNLVGEINLDTEFSPSMTSEDFAFMLNKKNGCYIWIGNGDSKNQPPLHSSHYDFNDEILSLGASFWVKLVEQAMPPIL